MLRLFPAVALFIVHMASTSLTVAGDSPLGCIPDEAVYILKIRNINNTLQKWEAVCDSLESLASQEWRVDAPSVQANEEESSWRTFIRDWVESIFPVAQNGADGQQDWWGFYWDVAEADAKMAYGFLIPADDLIELKESLDQTNVTGLETLIHDRWVIWANRPAMNIVKQCLADETKSIESQLPDDTCSLFANGDMTIFVNLDRMKAFRPEFVQDEVDGLRKTLTSFVPTEIKPIETKEVLKNTIDQVVSLVLQTLNDTNSLTLSLTLSESDLRIDHFHSLKAESRTAALFRDHPGTEMKSLSGLPPNSVLYFACERLQQATTAWFMQFYELMHGENKETVPTQFAEIRQGYFQLTYGTYAAAFPVFPLDQGYLRFVTNCEVDKPQRAHELDIQFTDLGEAVGQKTAENNQTPKPTLLKRSTERLGNQSVDVVQQPFPIQVGVNGAPQENNVESMTLGPDGNVTRTVCLQDRIIECVGGTRARAVATIRRATDAAQGRQVSDPGFSRTRNQLSSKANLIVMLDVGGAIAAGMELWNTTAHINSNPAAAGHVVGMKNVAGDDDVMTQQMTADATEVENGDVEDDLAKPIPADAAAAGANVNVVYKVDQAKIDSMRAASAYIGFSISLEPDGSRTTLVIPLEAIQNVVKLPDSAKEVLSEFFEGF